MQNFWWNRKFYHGKNQPDSFRLSRLEETDAATTETLSALAHAQTATDALNEEQGKLLGEHTALLSRLTDIAASLQGDVEQVSAECDSIGNELTALEQNDNVLSTRMDGIEEACADTAAEQATALNELASVTAEQATRLNELETVTTGLPARITALENKPVSSGSVVGSITFEGSGCNCALMGISPCGGVTLYSESGDAVHRFLPSMDEATIVLPSGGGCLNGTVESIRLFEGMLDRLDLNKMPTLKKLTLSFGNYNSVHLPDAPILTDVTLMGNNGTTLDLRKQTKLTGLTLQNCSADVLLPEALPNLAWLELDYEKAQDETFLDQYLIDRSDKEPGYLLLSGATPPDWVAERNWTVM